MSDYIVSRSRRTLTHETQHIKSFDRKKRYTRSNFSRNKSSQIVQRLAGSMGIGRELQLQMML